MKILIIDNCIERKSWGGRDFLEFQREAPGATFEVRRAPEGDLPKNFLSYDRIVLTGSAASATEEAPWIESLESLLRKCATEGKPVLGVCYGHQILARALGGKKSVRKSPTPEFGWSKIKLTGNSSLFQGLKKEFHSFSSHFDEVCELPPQAIKLAESERCDIQAYQVQGLPLFGVQFHPERTLEGAEETFQMCRKRNLQPYVLNEKNGSKLHDPLVAKTIFSNFFGNAGSSP